MLGENGYAVGGDHLGVFGPQNPFFCPRGNKRSWGVALPSDLAPRRASLARDRVPRGAFHQPGLFPSQAVYMTTAVLSVCTLLYVAGLLGWLSFRPFWRPLYAANTHRMGTKDGSFHMATTPPLWEN
jgi:hypothetical protein